MYKRQSQDDVPSDDGKIAIRKIPNGVLESLELIAKRNFRSIEAEARVALSEHVAREAKGAATQRRDRTAMFTEIDIVSAKPVAALRMAVQHIEELVPQEHKKYRVTVRLEEV